MTVTPVGKRWRSKDGTRLIEVESEASPWCGERMFMVRGLEGSNRRRQLSYSGLLRKYVPAEEQS
ncbi:hypothetical protein AB0H71_13980 [Nocardia sp. NPDC050697]|uniref:hypothetical protein n=1 Tax=Nocardia sp. NPDC050697 TaxID=3155158 RepID=UPI0033C8E71F